MLSVAKLTLGQEAYYEQQVVRGLDDYYAGRGESPGIWAGDGSASLGLVGVVDDGDLGTLQRGANPANDERLRAPVRERTITVRTLDVESGEWREEQKRLAPVSGYDLVFSCPKGVSLLHALSDDERVRREISEAHEAVEHVEHGYALTGHAAQGATAERAFVLLADRGALQEWCYVSCTRARTKTRLCLSEHDAIERETRLREPDPATLPGRAARALQRSAAEPLALSSSSSSSARAAEGLDAARRELKGLGLRRRGQRRLELQTEIAFRETALHCLDKKLAELRLAPTSPVSQSERDRVAPSRDQARQLHLERHRTRTLERRCGPELSL